MYNFNETNVRDNFDLLELEGRKIVFETFSGQCSDMYFTPDKYNSVDLFTTAYTGAESVWEIKKRDEKYTSYSFNGHILELDKYNALTSYTNSYRTFYVMVYTDAILFWNISKLNIDRKRFKKENKYHKTTAEPSGKVPKKVAYLTKDECCLIIYRNKDGNEQSHIKDSTRTYS